MGDKKSVSPKFFLFYYLLIHLSLLGWIVYKELPNNVFIDINSLHSSADNIEDYLNSHKPDTEPVTNRNMDLIVTLVSDKETICSQEIETIEAIKELIPITNLNVKTSIYTRKITEDTSMYLRKVKSVPKETFVSLSKPIHIDVLLSHDKINKTDLLSIEERGFVIHTNSTITKSDRERIRSMIDSYFPTNSKSILRNLVTSIRDLCFELEESPFLLPKENIPNIISEIKTLSYKNGKDIHSILDRIDKALLISPSDRLHPPIEHKAAIELPLLLPPIFIIGIFFLKQGKKYLKT